MTEEHEERVIEKCKICSRIEIEGHSPQEMAVEMRSHAKWLIGQRMTDVAMQVKDAAAMLEHLANDRSVVEMIIERIVTQNQYEFIVGGLDEKIDKLQSPTERGANNAARNLVRALSTSIEEGAEIEDDLMFQICGALQLHLEARKDDAAHDIRLLFELCLGKTLHLLDDEEKQMLRDKGLLEPE